MKFSNKHNKLKNRNPSIAIIGAGPSGLCMGKRLIEEGFDDFVIIERANDIGGTWYANRYPGCETDTPAVLYAFSFERATNTSSLYFKQPEVLKYLQRIADKYNIRSHCRFGNGVTKTEWIEDSCSWTITLDNGQILNSDIVVSAMGLFNKPLFPQIKGLDSFKGTIMHTSEWDPSYEFKSDRVALIGSGATAVQLLPELIKRAKNVFFFQRTPNYVIPKQSGQISSKQYKAVIANPEFYKEFRSSIEHYLDLYTTYLDQGVQSRLANSNLNSISFVNNPETRSQLLPNYPVGSRRISPSNEYYQSFNASNIELISDPIASIKNNSVVCSNGKSIKVDSIVLATGFVISKYLSGIKVVGKHGKRLDTKSYDHLKAYLGIMSAGLPNLFMLLGPNTYNGSAPTIIEIQVNYIIDHLKRMVKNKIKSVEVKSAIVQKYDRIVQSEFKNPAWAANNFSYYIPSTGRNYKVLPFTVDKYRQLTASIDPTEFNMS